MRTVVATLLVSAALAAPPAAAAGVSVRILPPDKAQFLTGQRFDFRVEATAAGATDRVTSMAVSIDDIDVTARGQLVPNASGSALAWVFRQASLGLQGPRVIRATAAGTAGSSTIDGAATSTITVRGWSSPIGSAARPELHRDLDAGSPAAAERAEEEVLEELHLGANHPLFHWTPEPSAETPRARNVILLIGDGMGVAHRTAARVLSKGYAGGKANGTLAMDRLPYNGMLMTSSLNSLITDSAPGAHNYSTGNKTNNGMEGVFPDNTSDDADNPRIENLSEYVQRHFGMVTGIVSDAFLTDATPAAFLAHTSNRGNGTLIASQYVDERDRTGLKVLLGGGAYHFIPKSRTGSRRTDERDVVADFKAAGFAFVETKTALNGFTPGPDARLLGLFHLDNMEVAFDKLKLGDPANVSAFPDQPFLADMTRKAIDTLKTYPNGFFLMVEAAHVDKQAHRMDAERSIYDVIQLDHAVKVALDFAMQTNSDADDSNDTLVLVSADHECAGLVLPAVGRPEKAGTRDYVKTYNYNDGAVANDSRTLNFTDYVDANGDGYPDNPNPGRKLIAHFGASPDHYEDWQSNAKPKDPGTTAGGVAIANPSDPDKTATGSLFLPGVIENGASGGEAQTQAVHTMADIQISAYGPGSSQFARVTDNTEAFFSIFRSIVGGYPAPTLY